MAAPSLAPPEGMEVQPQPQAPGTEAARPGNPQESQVLTLVQTIVSSARMLAQKVPGTADIARQVNDLMQEAQKKIISAGPAPQPMAPPQ